MLNYVIAASIQICTSITLLWRESNGGVVCCVEWLSPRSNGILWFSYTSHSITDIACMVSGILPSLLDIPPPSPHILTARDCNVPSRNPASRVVVN